MALKTQAFIAHGVVVQIYSGNKGDELPWHGHAPGQSHGHFVVSGSTSVEIESTVSDKNIVAVCRAGETNLDFPPDKKHSITILEDGTVYVNVSPLHASDVPHTNKVLMFDASEC